MYRAYQPRFDRDVAVKVLNDPVDDANWPRFERECRTLGALSAHPNIVTVYESGVTDDGHAYLILELCTGGSLAERAAGRPLPWTEVVDLGGSLPRPPESQPSVTSGLPEWPAGG